MPSPIRFRAFYRGRMLDVFAVNPMNQTVYLSHQQLYDEPGDDVLVPIRSEIEPEGAMLMQWTGESDANGCCIYEDDLVAGWIPDSERDREFDCAVVQFSRAAFDLFETSVDPKDLSGGYLGDL